MATIKPNEHAPAEEVRYILANEELVLASGGSTDTDDRAVISAAESHPWLEVEYPAPSETPEKPAEEDVTPLAVDAGLDQSEVVEEGGVSKTLAADETSSTDDSEVKKTSRKRS